MLASGDFNQLPPVKKVSLADALVAPDGASDEQRWKWEEDNASALQGLHCLRAFDSCIILEYSRRCKGELQGILTEMLTPGGTLSDRSWRALQNRVLGYLRENTGHVKFLGQSAGRTP